MFPFTFCLCLFIRIPAPPIAQPIGPDAISAAPPNNLNAVPPNFSIALALAAPFIFFQPLNESFQAWCPFLAKYEPPNTIAPAIKPPPDNVAATAPMPINAFVPSFTQAFQPASLPSLFFLA